MNVLLCPLADPGYLYPATSVALELQHRGHTVTLFSLGAAAAAATAAGIDVLPVTGLPEPRAFHVSRWYRSGLDQYRAVMDASRTVRPDVLVTSVLCTGALLAAEVLDVPVVVIGLACHLWPYRAGGPEGQDFADREWRLKKTLGLYHEARAEVGLPGRVRGGDGVLLGTAFLLRGHPDLEATGAELPEQVRHVGPCWWEPPADPAVLEPLYAALDRTGKQVVYIHLGRVFGGESLWPWIDSAFTETEFQAVVELGRSEQHQASTADVLAVRQPWMAPLIDRAHLAVSNGTTAPVLAALLRDRPLLLSPNGGEQQLLGSACRNAGVAAPLSRESRTDSLHSAVGDDALHTRARRLTQALLQAKSESLAAQAVEDACR